MTPILRNTFLLCLNFGIWSLNALTYQGSLTLFARKGLPINIETDPGRTRLSINGSIWRGTEVINGWLQTPTRILLPPGQHTITLERPGYKTHSSRVLMRSGDDEIRLNSELERTEEAHHRLEISTTDERLDNLNLTLNQGFEVGSPPLVVQDMTPGSHILEINPTNATKTSMRPLSCTFFLPADEEPKSYKITLALQNGRLTASHCRRLRNKP
jgi:hypothetical protein